MRDLISSFFGWGGDDDLSLLNGPVVLRPPGPRDFNAWREAMERDRHVLAPRQPTWPAHHLTLESFRRRLRVYGQERTRSMGFAFHIFHADDDRFLGVIRLSPIHYGAARSGTVGYWIAQPEWGKGFASLSLQAVKDFALRKLRLVRLEAHCLPDNEASRRVLEKAGFQQEGVLRHFLEIDGERKDHLLYACVAHSLHDEV